jgi:AcrR family transcriptional regulator
MAIEERPRHLRADAERNRRRVLNAAARAFAKHGLDVSISRIAAMAGVGQGTVFRHFASKEQLVAAVVRDRVEALVATGGALLDVEDAAAGVREFMRAFAAAQAEDLGLSEAVHEIAFADPDVHAAMERVLEVAGRLVSRAQRQGALRADVTGSDLVLLTCAGWEAAAPLHEVVPGLWQRYLDLILDGLRPEGAHPLSRPAPTQAQLDRAIRAKLRAAAHR